MIYVIASFWSACKVRYKAALGTLPKHRVAASAWLAKHDRMIRALRTIWRLPITVGSAFPQHALEFMKASDEWLRILRQGFQLAILNLKLRYFRAKERKLIREKAEFGRLQIEHVLFNPGGGPEADNVLGDLNGVHCHRVFGMELQKPNK